MQPAGLIIAIVLSSVCAAQSELPGSSARPRRTKLTPLPRESLKLGEIPFKIVYETYRPTDGKQNWELYTIKADGSEMANLTNTPDVDEMYPHVSPDGTKICFVVDEGQGRRKIRHVYYMNADGTDGTKRVHVAAHARQPCWCFDSKSIAYCNNEYKRYSAREYATSGVTFYHLEGNWSRPHRNVELHHLYGPTENGFWPPVTAAWASVTPFWPLRPSAPVSSIWPAGE